jgi:hypothetical protein
MELDGEIEANFKKGQPESRQATHAVSSLKFQVPSQERADAPG